MLWRIKWTRWNLLSFNTLQLHNSSFWSTSIHTYNRCVCMYVRVHVVITICVCDVLFQYSDTDTIRSRWPASFSPVLDRNTLEKLLGIRDYSSSQNLLAWHAIHFNFTIPLSSNSILCVYVVWVHVCVHVQQTRTSETVRRTVCVCTWADTTRFFLLHLQTVFQWSQCRNVLTSALAISKLAVQDSHAQTHTLTQTRMRMRPMHVFLDIKAAKMFLLTNSSVCIKATLCNFYCNLRQNLRTLKSCVKLQF